MQERQALHARVYNSMPRYGRDRRAVLSVGSVQSWRSSRSRHRAVAAWCRAHEREHLAKRAMTNDRDPGEARFGQHATRLARRRGRRHRTARWRMRLQLTSVAAPRCRRPGPGPRGRHAGGARRLLQGALDARDAADARRHVRRRLARPRHRALPRRRDHVGVGRRRARRTRSRSPRTATKAASATRSRARPRSASAATRSTRPSPTTARSTRASATRPISRRRTRRVGLGGGVCQDKVSAAARRGRRCRLLRVLAPGQVRAPSARSTSTRCSPRRARS